MALAQFSMLVHELLNKDPNIVPEEGPLIILDRNSTVCMSKMVRIRIKKSNLWKSTFFKEW